MAQNVVVGGDFKILLNSLSHVDESGIAQCLPFRPGKKGLHLIEAFFLGRGGGGGGGGGGTIRGMHELARKNLTETGQTSLEITGRVGELTKYFAGDLEAIKSNVAGGVELNREVMVLGDPSIEPLVAKLLGPYLPKT